MYFVAFDGEEIAGACRMCVHQRGEALPDAPTLGDLHEGFSWPCAFINRLVVSPDHRGRGASGRLDAARLEAAAQAGAAAVVATTQLSPRLESLRRAGFVDLGVAPHAFVSWSPTMVLAKSLTLDPAR